MAGELRLKTHQPPSIFNKDMLLGGLLASLVPVGFMATGIGAALGLAAAVTAAGAFVGGIFGKRRMEMENREGKPVGVASFWNKDTLIGALLGFKSAGLVAAVAGVLTIGGTLATIPGAPAAAPFVLTGGIALTLLSLVATPLIGAYIGGKMGEKRQKHEYEEAKKQQIVEHVSQNVSPEIGQAVGYAMEHKKDWGKNILEDKLLAAARAQEPVR